MIEFEMTGRVGRDLRPDDVRIVAAKEMNLRGNAVINVIDPTKSYQPTFPNAAATCVIARRSIDARNDVVYRYRIEAYNHRFESYVPYEVAEYRDVSDAEPVIIVGAGPAGLFAALKLLTLGLKPVILERGKNVHDRKFDMAKLSREGVVDPDSNYCYGEGGAGAFSDGKLFTRSSKRGDIKEVLHQFVNFGANPQILVDAHPHIGTDRLPKIVENIRLAIEEKGGEYHFGTRVTDIVRKKDGTIEVKALDSEHLTKTTGKPKAVKYSVKKVILASGHSAKDIYEMLSSKDCTLEAKGFAMGVRVEHPQSLINESRYHGRWEPEFPAAEYSFTEQVEGRGVFSFCMCPGGVLVPSATEPGTIVMNGMSNSARSGKFANAGVVVQIDPDDIPEEYASAGPLKGLEFQKAVERKMWEYSSVRSGNPMAAPAQRMIDFCNGVVSEDLPESSYKPGVVSGPLHELLPEFISSRLQKAFPEVNKHSIRGFFTNDALLVGVESRTSSPVRVPRDPETLESISFPGLLPCGEGAGYSGGIVSSAIDGINCALAVFRSLSSSVPEPVEGPVVREANQPE
jgi:uncharacterized FAD-dependent dehydrogenase